MAIGSRVIIKQRILTAAVCGALPGSVAMPSDAAELLLSRHGVKHVWTSRIYGSWRDRCAYAGYYCLYAEYGYVYAYPFDDRPVAYAHYRRRFR